MRMGDNLVETKIRGVLPTAAGHTVFLQAGAFVYVVHIDGQNGQALAGALNGIEHDRPLTHELMYDILDGLEVEIDYVVINEVEDSMFYARIFLSMENELGTKIVEVDARPSDAMVLSVLMTAPLFTEQAVLDKVENVSQIIDNMLTKDEDSEENEGEDDEEEEQK